ncbi:lipopolysaccharide biosynthesis protein [Paenibacillus thiaminolyticus]|nr:oligosaccharide flippase family protein [Paenibacillus thiaminolyticus]QDM47372.1 oligosaccharide flippase family protein [Paenibacillus thiaminolyticus]CAH8705330.1 oligosaccharide flippase family protein [Paenibacillus thiaminolyticus]SUA50656.1 Polysaccharide biosynthesis protein [Paenibacillus thiaminolyticus]
MRIRNSLYNIFFGLLGQAISTIMGFVVRTVFIWTLGVEYLGVSGLFSDVLMLLSLANLGFETAIIYSLYQPLADRDEARIKAFMHLFRKAYLFIGMLVLVLGLSLIPFLDVFIQGETTVSHIEVIYVLFLLNSVSTYFFAYKQAIIVADQQQHVISRIHSVYVIAMNTIQIIVLLCSKNYILFLVIQIGMSVLRNKYISRVADRKYEFLREPVSTPLDKGEKKTFFQNLRSLLMYKVSGVVINGTDNLIIANLFGVIWVGLYSNYYLILTTLTTFVSYFFYSLTASVGNLNATEDKEKKFFFYRVLRLANFWVFGLSAVCLWNLLDPVIILWLGGSFVLGKETLLAILLNFYTTGMQNASTMFRDTTGMFRRGRYSPLIAAAMNIGLSITLARFIGMPGVFLGTVISRLLTYFWVDPYLLHKHVFLQPLRPYFTRYALHAVLVLLAASLCGWLAGLLTLPLLWDIAVRVLLCLSVTNLIFYVCFRKSSEFIYLTNIAKANMGKLPILTKFNPVIRREETR